MVTTIGDDGPWDYLPLVNETIRILLTIIFGIVMGYFKIFEAESFVPIMVRYLFYVALPLHVFKGLGIAVDLYDDSFLWSFIGAFLILRALALVASFGIALVNTSQKNSSRSFIGTVAVMWLALTWISTILGIPVLTAIFGSPTIGMKYGILAGVSAIIFQLPLQLLLFDFDVVLTQEYDKEKTRQQADDGPSQVEQGEVQPKLDPPVTKEQPVEEPPEEVSPTIVQQPRETKREELQLLLRHVKKVDVYQRVLIQFLYNPVAWGFGLGLVLTLSKLGPRFLNPMSKDFVPGLAWIATTTGWLSDSLSPMSLFLMGVWIQNQPNAFREPLLSSFLFMIAKLVLVPLVMVALAKAFDLDDEAGRSAVIIAALPVVAAAFPLASSYNLGEGMLTQNIIWGTLLMLPTIMVWNLAMDAIDLFPIPETGGQ